MKNINKNMKNMSNKSNVNDRINEINKNIDEIDIKISKLKKEKSELLELKSNLQDKQHLQKSIELSEQSWNNESYTWSVSLKEALNNIFNIKSFRSQQLNAINAFLSNHDILLLAPTGGGKSLCYQLPAVIDSGLTLVISPLISLMKDQVWSLNKLGIEAETLSSSSSKNENSKIISNLIKGSKLKLLYVTPERLSKSKRFMNALQKCYSEKRLSRIAIDEVHCCSQWGHDYRPDYKYLGTLKSLFPDIPILGATATATSKVIVDVQKILNIQGCIVFRAPFNRPNLYYHVIEKPTEKEKVLDLLANLLKKRYKGQSGIIYTFSIKDSEDIAAGLAFRDCKVRPYHANLEPENKNKTHSDWLKSKIQAVVATIAFGMGIDKPDVRFVIHHTVSKSIENFYQESGRAGRDGKRSECILMFRFSDMFKITTMVFSEYTGLKNAYAMMEYCINGTKCRREIIAEHFSEVWEGKHCNNMCDRCLFRNKILPPQKDISKHCRDLIHIIHRAQMLNINLTGLKLIDAWFHKGPKNVQLKDIKPPNMDRYYAEQIIISLLILGYLKEDFQYTSYATNSYIKKGSTLLNEKDVIQFNGARVLSLPNNDELDSSNENKTTKKRVKLSPNKSKNGDRLMVDTIEEMIESEKKRRRKSQLNQLSNSFIEPDADVICMSQHSEVIEID